VDIVKFDDIPGSDKRFFLELKRIARRYQLFGFKEKIDFFVHPRSRGKEPSLNKKIFKKEILMGNGKFSVMECSKLLDRVSQGMSLLSCLQQPAHPGSEQEWEESKKIDKKMEKQLKLIVEDIVMALSGKKIDLKKDTK